MIKKCLHLSVTALTLTATLLCVSLSIAEADLAKETSSQKSESTPIVVPKDSVLHLIPEQTLGLIYCPNSLELDNSINTLVAELSPQAEVPDVVAKTLSNTFKAQFEGLGDFEEIGLDLNQDFAIILTRLNPLQFALLVHLRDPEAMQQIIEKVTNENDLAQYNGVTYWNDSADAESFAILENILVFSKQREVCENVIDTYNGTIQAITQNPDYASFLTDISEDNDQLAVYFDVESAIATLDKPLAEELQVVIDKIEDADEEDDIAPFLEGISAAGIPFIKQVRSASVRLEMEGADVQIKPFLKFESDSKFLKILEEASDELVFLSELPNNASLNCAFQGSPILLTEISKFWFSVFPDDTREKRTQRDALREQMKDFYESLADRWSFSLNLGDPPMPVFIYELKDVQSAKIYMDEVFLEKLNDTGAYPGKSIVHNRVEIKSYVFPNFKADLPEEVPGTSNLVPSEWHWYYAFTEGQLLFATGTTPEILQTALDRRAGGEEKFSDHQSYQKLIGKLGTDNNVFLALSPITAFKSLALLMGDPELNDPNMAILQIFSGMFMNLPETYSLGFAAKAKNNGIDANLLLNLGDFKQLTGIFGMMEQIMPQMMPMQ